MCRTMDQDLGRYHTCSSLNPLPYQKPSEWQLKKSLQADRVFLQNHAIASSLMLIQTLKA